ncbi:TRAP transporter large permease subunit [Bradyrhizobium sp. KB893862 SZCCT0404]|uniref:TRAP transporter large permease n=1 Tax=Bradyrhizobium sp. KB893862 SZCCT0404 TaxID=2807672 RepID=UPI001BA91C5F|nr:TRAP transporter large permease subunit [Bradyrhizobium sp. KB893862 SZCCT0404]MBR1175231.1 TRAP transporter large permease subunit [Bradyrhizobium sp. KB893862 SZCCT0404]
MVSAETTIETRQTLSLSWLSTCENVLGRTVEIAAMGLVVVETLVLFAGVVSRYAFHRPLSWSDELASILFLWLAMLGTVIAFRRNEHMRMTALISLASPRRWPFFEAFALVAALCFLLAIFYPSIEYALDEIAIVTPAMQVSNIVRSAALPLGCGFMLLFGAIRFVRLHRLADLSKALTIIVLVGLALVLAKPLIMGIGNYRLLIFFVLLVGAAVFSGVPIAFSFGLGTLAYLFLATRVPMTVIVSRMDEGMSHLILLSVPLFVFLGLLIELTGMARAMVNLLASLIGHLRGGLSYVLLAAMYLVSGISGSKAADMAAIAPVLFPEMKRRGEKGGELVALLTASGAMSETIPPSLVLITIGSVTGVSIAALFTGGLIPAFVLAVALSIVVWWRSRKADLSHVRRAGASEIGRALLVAAPGIALPFLIRAAVIEGVATATEVSTIGIIYTLLYGLVAWAFFGARIGWSRLGTVLLETAALSGAILLIIGTATAMAWALTQSGFSRQLVAAMSTMPGGQYGFLAITIVTLIVLGSVLEGIPAIVLFGPLLFPVAKAMGINEVHYAMVAILAMGIGLFAPPLGIGYYTACAIGKVDPTEGIRPLWLYLVALVLGLIAVAAIPWLTTCML